MKKRTLAWYIFIFPAAVCFFVIVLFPGERMIQSLSARMNAGNDPVRFTADQARLGLPLKMMVPKGELVLWDLLHLMVTDLSVRPEISSMFKDQKNIRFNAGLPSGELDGKITGFRPENGGYEKIDLVLQRCSVDNYTYKTGTVTVILSFQVAAKVTYEHRKGLAKGDFQLTDVRVTMPENSPMAMAGIDSLQFDRIEAGFEIEKDHVKVSRFSARGPRLSVDLKGTLLLTPPLPIKLKGEMQPDSSMISKLKKTGRMSGAAGSARLRKINLQVSGTVDDPEFRLN